MSAAERAWSQDSTAVLSAPSTVSAAVLESRTGQLR